MRFFGDTNIDFIGKRKIAFVVSITLILLSVIFLIVNKGLNYSIDFTGGVSLELDLTPNTPQAEHIDIQQIRDLMVQNGYEDIEIQTISTRSETQTEGRDIVLLKTKASSKNAAEIVDIIRTAFPNNVEEGNFIRLQEEVGPRIGEELREKAILAIFWALVGIIIYIWWRFEFTFGITAVIALFHDILITLGVFVITGRELSLTIVAALLTIVGYSLNDTIVVFDRIREDLKIYRRETYSSVINHSINETLSRTIITSLTTLVVVLSLYIFGGTVIHDFAFALLVGVLVGTYSSIFVASPLLVEHFIRRDKKRGITKRKKR
ncbi:MAG TPA: protein translocase subunit SecF [Candidatus Cloacimonas sp.]|jgi:preprotein translocase subunit SecF|nr:preprotein translocase subunit SecF [Candidatus Cloacimonadota bacterium]HCX73302.1 protein translocase subunit SecF [Candidatus Cloacimonas sp.]